MLKAQVTTVPLSECNQTYLNYNRQANHIMYRNGVKESHYCAQNPNERKGSCKGDSGGPLQFFPNNSRTAHVIGLISIGVGCGALPTIHTRVAYFADWIESHVWPNGITNQSSSCEEETYGCCPDNVHSATGPNFEGCNCQYSTYGCCPDNTTAAKGYENAGCGCQYEKYGCCLDQVTLATGTYTF